MTIQDIVNMEKENKDSIVLLKEGIFWKAYEMSAYLFHTYIKPFKLLRKYVETIKGDVVSLGFPVAGTEKQLQGLNVLLHEDDKIILSVSQTEPFTEDDFWNKALNGLNLMGEYYDSVWNVGTNYSVWKDRINVVAALYDNRFLSVGIYFRVCLK